jgi:hypothetical protein
MKVSQVAAPAVEWRPNLKDCKCVMLGLHSVHS